MDPRLVSLIAGLVFLELFWVAGVLGQATIAALCGARVERVSFGFGPRLFRVWRFQVAMFPLGGFVRIAGLHPTEGVVQNDDRRAFFNRPWLVRALIVLGWPIGAQLFLCAAAAASFQHFGVASVGSEVVVTQVVPDLPASEAGMQEGDELLSIAGRPATRENLKQLLAESSGSSVEIEVRRGAQTLRLAAPRRLTEDGSFRLGVAFGPKQTLTRVELDDALLRGLMHPIGVQRQVVAALYDLADSGATAEVAGPVGLASMVATQPDQRQQLDLLLAIGAYLVVWSLLPIPPLPGAQLLGVLIGWRSRRGRNDFAAREVQTVAATTRSFPILLVIGLLPLGGMAALLFRDGLEVPERAAFGAALVLLCLVLAGGLPRAWAWGLYVPLLLIPGVMLSGAHDRLIVVGGLLVTPLIMLLPGVRRYFRQECPVCRQVAGRPVRSARAHSCLACGSVWTLTE